MAKEVDEVKGISGNMLQLFEEIWQIKQNKKEDTLTKESIVELCEKHGVSVEEVQNLAVEIITLGKFKSFSDFQSDMLSDDDLDEIAGGKFSARRGIATLLTAISGVGNFLGSSSSAFAMKNGNLHQTTVSASPTTRVAPSTGKKIYEKAMENIKKAKEGATKAAGKVAQTCSDAVSKESSYIQKTFGLNATNAAALAGAVDLAAVILISKTLGMAVTALTGSNSKNADLNSKGAAESSQGHLIMNFAQAVRSGEIRVNVDNYSEGKPLTLLIANTNNDSKAILVELAYDASKGNAQVSNPRVTSIKESQNAAAITMTPDVYAKTFFGAENVQLILDDKSSALKFKSVGDNSKNQNLTDATLNPQQALYVSEYIRVIKNSNTKANAEAAKNISNLTKELESTKADLETKNSTIDSLNADKAKLDEALNAKNTELEEACAKSDKAKAEVERLSEEKTNLENGINQKNEELETLRSELNARQTELGTLRKTISDGSDEKAKSLAELTSKYAELEQQLREKNEEIAKTKAEKDEIEVALANANTKANETQATVDSISKEKAKLTSKYAELEQQLRDTAEKLAKEKADLEVRIKETEKLAAEAQEKINSLEEAAKKEDNALKLEQAETEITTLKAELATAKADKERLVNEKMELQRQLESSPPASPIPVPLGVPSGTPPPPPPPPPMPGQPGSDEFMLRMKKARQQGGSETDLTAAPQQTTKHKPPASGAPIVPDPRAALARLKKTGGPGHQPASDAEIYTPAHLFKLCDAYKDGIPKDKLNEVINDLSPVSNKMSSIQAEGCTVVKGVLELLINIDEGRFMMVNESNIESKFDASDIKDWIKSCKSTLGAVELTQSIVDMINNTRDTLNGSKLKNRGVAAAPEASSSAEQTPTISPLRLTKLVSSSPSSESKETEKINTLEGFLELCEKHKGGIDSAEKLNNVIGMLQGITDGRLTVLASNVRDQLVLIQEGKNVPQINWNLFLSAFKNKGDVKELIKNMITKTCEKPFAKELKKKASVSTETSTDAKKKTESTQVGENSKLVTPGSTDQQPPPPTRQAPSPPSLSQLPVQPAPTAEEQEIQVQTETNENTQKALAPPPSQLSVFLMSSPPSASTAEEREAQFQTETHGQPNLPFPSALPLTQLSQGAVIFEAPPPNYENTSIGSPVNSGNTLPQPTLFDQIRGGVALKSTEKLTDTQPQKRNEPKKGGLIGALMQQVDQQNSKGRTEGGSDDVKKIETPDDLFELCDEYKDGIKTKDDLDDVLNNRLQSGENAVQSLNYVLIDLYTLLNGMDRDSFDQMEKGLTHLCDISLLQKCLDKCESKCTAETLSDAIFAMIRNTYAQPFVKKLQRDAAVKREEAVNRVVDPRKKAIETQKQKELNNSEIEDERLKNIIARRDSVFYSAQQKSFINNNQQDCEKRLFDLFLPYKDSGILLERDLGETFDSFKALLSDRDFRTTLDSSRYVHDLTNCLDNLIKGVAFDTARAFNKCFLDCTYYNEEDEMGLKDLLPRVIKKTYNQEFATKLRKNHYEKELFELFLHYQNGITTAKNLKEVLRNLKNYSIMSEELPAIKSIQEYLEELSKCRKPNAVPTFDGVSYKSGKLTLKDLMDTMIANTQTTCDTLINDVQKKATTVHANRENTIREQLPAGYVNENSVLSSEKDAEGLLKYLEGKTDNNNGNVVADLKSKLGLLISGAWVNADFELTKGENNWLHDDWYDCIVRTAKSSDWAPAKQKEWFDTVLKGECRDSKIDPFEVLSRKAITCTEGADKLSELVEDLEKLKGANHDGRLNDVVDNLTEFFKNLLGGELSQEGRWDEEAKIRETLVSDGKKVSGYPKWMTMLGSVIDKPWVKQAYATEHPEDFDQDMLEWASFISN